jgi:hypothetical protein
VSKAAHVAKSVPASAAAEEILKGSAVLHRVAAAAYSCLATVLCKTQVKEAAYEAFLFKEKAGERFWARVVDCDVAYDFTSSGDTAFETVFVGGAGVGELMNAAPRRRPRPLSGGGAGSYLLSQYAEDAVCSSSLTSQRAIDGPVGGAGAAAGGLSRRPSYSQSQSQALSQDLDDLGLILHEPTQRRNNGADGAGAGGTQLPTQHATQAAGPGLGAAMEGEVVGEDDRLLPVPGFDDCTIALEMQPVNRQPCMAALVRRLLLYPLSIPI